MLKALILDFDGVIIDSADIKTEAFRELFKSYPEHLDAIIDYHLRHGGVSRYRKFAYIYEEILEQPLSREKLEELGEEFSKLVVEKVARCPFVPGALEFLEEYSGLRLFVASGTPEEELRRIVESRGLSRYFQGVYGTPALKSEIIIKILEEEGLNKKEVVFVGDSRTDCEEAGKAAVAFIGFLGESSNNPFAEYQIPKVRNFKELKKLLEDFNEIPASFTPDK